MSTTYRLPLAILVLGLSSLACANTGSISGRVVDALDGTPVAGVEVAVKGTQLRSMTGTDGAYVLEDVIPGPQQIAVGSDTLQTLGELTVTVGARSEVAAEDLKVVPVPPADGVFARVGGELRPMITASGAAVHPRVGSDFQLVAYAIEQRMAPKQLVVSVPSDASLLVRDGDPQQTIGVYPAQEGAVSLDAFSNRRERTWLVKVGKPTRTLPSNGGVQLVPLTGLDPGVWAIVRGAKETPSVSIMRVRAPGPALDVPAGTWAADSPERGRINDYLLAACAKAEERFRSGCNDIVPFLEKPVAPPPGCSPPSVTVPANPTFGDSFNFGDPVCGKAVQATFEYDDGWRLAQLWVEEPFAGDPDEEASAL